MMNLENIYDFLLGATDKNYIVTFDDDDSYRIADLDLAYSTDMNGKREEEPIYVSFNKCIGKSNKILKALKSGPLNIPDIFWTSEEPIEPVGASYSVKNIKGIFDDDKQYYIYEK